MSFLPRWPIGLMTSSLRLPQPIYPTFTSYCIHGPAGYHSCYVGPLNLLPYFYHLYSFFLSFYLLLDLFCTFFRKWTSTFSPLSMWIALTIHTQIILQFSFVGFLNSGPHLVHLFCHEQACLFKFPNLSGIPKHHLCFI